MMDNPGMTIPSYLDEPERILLWTADEFLFLIFPLFLGICFGYFITGMIGGVLLMTSYSRLKHYIGEQILPGLIYWYFPLRFSRFKATPPSYIREYVG